MLLHAGLDIGSTTVKAVVLDDCDRILFSRYNRHFADLKNAVGRLVDDIKTSFSGSLMTLSMAGSGALEIAKGLSIPFTQEQIACSASIAHFLPDVNVSIELGGEDAKITFFDKSGIEQRMNETCAGGTGAFIDQMASLFGTDAAGLNDLAKGYSTIYPVASRCGVFAKTDVQALLNDGVSKSDAAASIFQAIVNQTISGLACGRKIRGKVAFLGGPLYFLSELRRRFSETLKLTQDTTVFPKNPHLFVALGAAISAKNFAAVAASDLQKRAEHFFVSHSETSKTFLPPLFASEAEKSEFNARHSKCAVKRIPLKNYSGDAYLGIDVGSTTTKVVLISRNGELLFSRYEINGVGEPVQTVKTVLTDMYNEIPNDVHIISSGATGYGEKLIKDAFGVDVGEVETVAHSRAANFVLPGVDFVIDIGGQDMKCLKLRDGVIDAVYLNEACSSGCGSFLQSFAKSLNLSMDDFARAAEASHNPVDLGSRCTVFMNSRVRQAQKEGASIEDISSGLVYSVVKNALYKVLKIKDPSELGEKIVVQGGTFKNNSLLRAFELVTKRNVVRPDISELMGAFGAALAAREDAGKTSTLITKDELKNFKTQTTSVHCGGCGNNCLLTITKFTNGKTSISGNRCEKMSGVQKKNNTICAAGTENAKPENLFEKKYHRLFNYYKPLDKSSAPRGVIGIPRALNIYEDYPFWFTLLTHLGFSVQLSSPQPDENLGIDTISSQTLCYPAKLVHRHICDLLRNGIKTIFYPVLLNEKNEFKYAQKNYNCAVITGYPDVAFLNIDELQNKDVKYLKPELTVENISAMAAALKSAFADFSVSDRELRSAIAAAMQEMKHFKADVEEMGRTALERLNKNGGIGIVLAGHPYHLNPEVNHGIPELICSFGVTLFTEDSVCGMAREIEQDGEIGAVDQWVYHSRLYRAAIAVARHPAFKNVELIQLNSFGCGLDAISTEQTAEIIRAAGKLYTLLKIDEGKNNGAVKIRIRSLLSAVKMRQSEAYGSDSAAANIKTSSKNNGETFSARTLSERKLSGRTLAERTLLCPPMSEFHFRFFETAFEGSGYNLKVLPEGNRATVDLGMRYVNNDVCYPAMMVIGQFIDALRSGAYDPDKTDCLYAQTGGPCRASNYVHLLRGALDSAGFPQVRIFAANSQKEVESIALSVPLKTYWRMLLGVFYGDMLMRLVLRTRPYEKKRGDTDKLYEEWSRIINEHIRTASILQYKADLRKMTADFSSVEIDDAPRIRVGIVGEILVKFHANANDRLIELIESEGGEAVLPDLSGFLSYCLYDPIFRNKSLGGKLFPRLSAEIGERFIEMMKSPMAAALKNTRYGLPHSIGELTGKAADIVSLSNQGGEGWLLTAEMVKLIENGVNNILCVQPFACLPNHITGKGVIKELKKRFPDTNILPLDYDASVSSTNQLNRIKLLIATAKQHI